MLRTVELTDYLPEYLKEYRELNAVLRAENSEIKTAEDETEIIIDNQFIFTADTRGLKRYEEMLGLLPGKDDTTESRRQRVFMRWNNGIPYTWRVLLKRLDALCGHGNYEIIPHFHEYELILNTGLAMCGQVDELDYLLQSILPANLAVRSRNKLYYFCQGTLYLAYNVVKVEHYRIDAELIMDYHAQGSVFGGYSIITNKAYELSYR